MDTRWSTEASSPWESLLQKEISCLPTEQIVRFGSFINTTFSRDLAHPLALPRLGETADHFFFPQHLTVAGRNIPFHNRYSGSPSPFFLNCLRFLASHAPFPEVLLFPLTTETTAMTLLTLPSLLGFIEPSARLLHSAAGRKKESSVTERGTRIRYLSSPDSAEHSLALQYRLSVGASGLYPYKQCYFLPRPLPRAFADSLSPVRFPLSGELFLGADTA